jgi:hypothetical protein
MAGAALRAGTAFVVPLAVGVALRAGTALLAEVTFFTAMLGPFMVALRRPVASRRPIAGE